MAGESKPVSRLKHSITHGNIWLAALSLMKGKKVYAYALPEQIAKNFGYSPSRLMTYFVLYKLEDEKLISAKFEGRRKYYEPTMKGRAALLAGKKLLLSISKKL